MKIQVSESINPSSSSSVSSASDDKGSSIHANFQYVKKVPGGASRTMTKTEEVSALNSVTTNTFSSDGTDKYDPSTHHVVTETSPSKIPSQPFCGDSEKSMKKMVLSPPSESYISLESAVLCVYSYSFAQNHMAQCSHLC